MKKTYNRPRLTVHGGATAQTQGKRLGDEYDLRDGFRWSW